MPHVNGELQPSNVKSIAVYDVANFGTDLFLPLTDVGLTETALTFSTVTMTRDTDGSNQPLDTFPFVYSDTDDGLLLNEGDNAIYNQTYTLNPDMTAILYKVSLNFCAVLTCSAYTSGGLNIGGLHIKISERSSNDRMLYESRHSRNNKSKKRKSYRHSIKFNHCSYRNQYKTRRLCTPSTVS